MVIQKSWPIVIAAHADIGLEGKSTLLPFDKPTVLKLPKAPIKSARLTTPQPQKTKLVLVIASGARPAVGMFI